jgi:phosphopantetheine adenylyltransferase
VEKRHSRGELRRARHHKDIVTRSEQLIDWIVIYVVVLKAKSCIIKAQAIATTKEQTSNGNGWECEQSSENAA